jgi:3-oxoacyl-[acyl-carrier-protein] synthase III
MGDAELSVLEGRISHLLDNAGTTVRYALGQDEEAINLALSAATSALGEADVSPESVDLVIYAGVGRAFIEPAMANVIQSELGLRNATCFDILDGCTSWLRALQVADRYLSANASMKALIVNCECAFGRYVDSQIRRLDDLESCFATLTIGEAATATIVDGSEASNFYFNFKNFGEQYGLCMIPLENAPEFLRDEQGSRAPMKLFSLSRHLLAFAADRIVEMFDADPSLQEPFDICFGHAASKRAEEGVLRRLGIPLDLYFGTHATHGNTVSAAVPLAMSLAIEAGRLKRGSRVLAITAAGGVAIGLAKFTF